MSYREDIAKAVAEFRAAGIDEPLFVVPVAPFLCFAPCGMGRCVCSPNVGKDFVVVTKEGKHVSYEYHNEKLHSLNLCLQEIDTK